MQVSDGNYEWQMQLWKAFKYTIPNFYNYLPQLSFILRCC